MKFFRPSVCGPWWRSETPHKFHDDFDSSTSFRKITLISKAFLFRHNDISYCNINGSCRPKLSRCWGCGWKDFGRQCKSFPDTNESWMIPPMFKAIYHHKHRWNHRTFNGGCPISFSDSGTDMQVLKILCTSVCFLRNLKTSSCWPNISRNMGAGKIHQGQIWTKVGAGNKNSTGHFLQT